MDGKKRSPMTINNLSQYRKSWDRIKPFLQSNGYVVFLSCLTAWGDAGTRLLKALSKLLPDQTIVGFNTIGYQHPGDAKRRGKACMDFKIKSTDTKLVRSHGYYVKKYNKFLLQNINCKEAKWVRNGIVRRWPMDEWTFHRNLTDKFGRPKDMLKHKDTLNLRSRQLKKRALHQ